MTAEIRFTDGVTLQYKQARILNSGWVKATEQSGAADYIPPRRVQNVTGDSVYVGNGDQL